MTVGAYRIRPKSIHVDKLAHSGVCDTPLHELFFCYAGLFVTPDCKSGVTARDSA